MTEQSANSQDTATTSWPAPAPADAAVSIGVPGNRTTENDHCPECGEHVLRQMDVCPACGGSLRQAPRQIRCMHCNTTASSELVVCPSCGRELREAPPKVITYGAPVVVALLVAILLITQWHRITPIAWARTNLLRGVSIVEKVGASIEPEMVIVMTPVVEGSDTASSSLSDNGVNLVQAASVENVVVSDTAIALGPSVVTPMPNALVDSASSVSTTLEAAELPVGIGGPEPTMPVASAATESLPTATATDTPVSTSTPIVSTATSNPTSASTSAPAAQSTRMSTPTPTWTLQATATSKVTEGVLSPTPTAKAATGGIAQIAAIAASAATTVPTALPTAIVAVTPLPTSTPTPLVYQIKPGDTLVTIAAKYHVDVDALMAANQISGQGVYVIQPGEMLFIPTPAPTPTPATIRVEAPILMVPPDNATVDCATGGELIWQRVQFVKDSDKYVLHLGFVNGKDSNGQEKITWVLDQSGPVTQTSWQLDTSLCDLAPAVSEHQWRWWVEVVENANGDVAPVSPPSQIYRFVWK